MPAKITENTGLNAYISHLTRLQLQRLYRYTRKSGGLYFSENPNFTDDSGYENSRCIFNFENKLFKTNCVARAKVFTFKETKAKISCIP